MNIEELYRQQESESSPLLVEDQEWLKLEIALKRKEFYTFSFYHFNIYYALIIMTGLISTGAFFIHSYHHIDESNHRHLIHQSISLESKGYKVIKKETLFVQPGDTAVVEKLGQVLNDDNGQPKRVDSRETLSPDMITLQDSENSDVEITPVLPLQKMVDTTAVLSSDSAVTEIKEPIIIHVRDTIYHVDSIKVSKRKLKKLSH